MRIDEIRNLIRMVEESSIAELEITEGRRRVRISRNSTSVAGSVSAPATPAHPVAASAAPATDAPPASASETEALASNLKQITSPMVGTFYRSPAPGSDPFVEPGQAVSIGQTVCIVEAMKLMNEIGSDFNGKLRQILVENGQPVEYGQPLFLVEVK